MSQEAAVDVVVTLPLISVVLYTTDTRIAVQVVR